MILLHRLSTAAEPLHLNPDLIAHIEELPDCHVTLLGGAKHAVRESAEEVVSRIRAWRVDIHAAAIRQAR